MLWLDRCRCEGVGRADARASRPNTRVSRAQSSVCTGQACDLARLPPSAEQRITVHTGPAGSVHAV
eukprot:scaffold134125_cov99-Phaeocystis_antarctica.AAC.2